ncbi:uncharacterized protein LOC111707239 isoform X2 [Eurytemora carolleeae]|uniref:uncharacterized protein LOC111707239 isoform X2 n=1 Tax=Eurytemora carolleeae TaxID=1294199 RepID=UPI000C778328|nr:uncharacterized protein LOC111707239 isoform X2 [Eurytemora carolleeae]|eukprot:XP_023336070.1 uncharacterized protein LOC111707239 isoform X2 [Eurytemora affinis]
MVKHRQVLSLRSCSLHAVPKLVKENIVRAAHATQSSWYRVFTGDFEVSSDKIVDNYIIKFREYILQHVIWTDREEVFKLVMKGMEDGFLQVRKSWRPDKDHTQYSKVLEAVSKFTDVLKWPKLNKLDFGDVPRTMRSRILELIPQFLNLSTLIIGPGSSGGWIPIKGAAALHLSCSISELKQLQIFSLKKDCTMDILSAVVLNSGTTLRVLDVENSKRICSDSVPVILQCSHLVELNIYGTKINDESKARLIMGLPKLRHLTRADFLCDALGWIDYLEELEDPVFDIREFMPSQSYYFHETWQLEIVSRMCPRIEKMLFIHHRDTCPSLLPISDLKHLTDLQLHGGHWTSSEMDKLIQAVGGRLHNLGLISVKGLDIFSLKAIFSVCDNLNGIVFNNCDFSSQFGGVHVVEKVCKLKELVLTSNTREEYTAWLLRAGINLKIIHLGCSTHVTDSLILQALENGCLKNLQGWF